MINLSCKWHFNLNKAAVCRFSFVNVGKFLIRIRKEHLTCFSAAVLLIRSLYLFFIVVLLFDSEMLLDINQLCRLRHFMLY
jgi:hypothetical protein